MCGSRGKQIPYNVFLTSCMAGQALHGSTKTSSIQTWPKYHIVNQADPCPTDSTLIVHLVTHLQLHTRISVGGGTTLSLGQLCFLLHIARNDPGER